MCDLLRSIVNFFRSLFCCLSCRSSCCKDEQTTTDNNETEHNTEIMNIEITNPPPNKYELSCNIFNCCSCKIKKD